MSGKSNVLFVNMANAALRKLGPKAYENDCDLCAVTTHRLPAAKRAAMEVLGDKLKGTKSGRRLVAKALAYAFWAWNADVDISNDRAISADSHAVSIFMSFARHVALLES